MARVLGPFFRDIYKSWHFYGSEKHRQHLSETIRAIDRSKKLPLLKSFALAAAAGLTINQQDASTDDRFFAHFAAFVVKYLDSYRLHCPERLICLVEDLGSDRGNATFFEQAVLNNSFNRPLFTTKDERYGLGPQNLQAEDIICILFGSKVPLVLRRFGVWWRFVGAAYVNSIMSGQYVQEL